MKKKFIWPASVLALGLSLAGCKDALQIEPQQSIDAANAYNTSQKVSAAVVGAYARLDDPRLYGTDLILVPELLGELGANYIVWNGSFQNYNQLYRRTQISTLSNAQGIWTQAYNAINQCNLILANLTAVTDAGQRTQFEGEAEFIRATMYFELVRLYAQQYTAGGANAQDGVPISLTPVTTTEQADTKLPPLDRTASVHANNQRFAAGYPEAAESERDARFEVFGRGDAGPRVLAAGQLHGGPLDGQ